MFEDKIAEMNKHPESIAPVEFQYEKRVYTVDEIQDGLSTENRTEII